jgi:CheY-like chemotaxis protein
MSAQLASVVPLTLLEPASRGLILHVDDDDAVRRSTTMLMRAAGYETREAAYGEQALAQVDSLHGRLDVLIVDYHLGNSLTGTEVAEEFARL